MRNLNFLTATLHLDVHDPIITRCLNNATTDVAPKDAKYKVQTVLVI